MANSERLKILCLHGYRQNADSFKSKLGSFRKYLKNYAEFTFITALHQAPPLNQSDPIDETQKSWWFNKDDGSFKGTNQDGPAIGFDESLKLVENVWNEQGPFNGLLGFSQGACFVGLICVLSKKQLTVITPEFVIVSSGFRSGSLQHKDLYEEGLIDIPSLHIYGENDDIIPGEMSKFLMLSFKESLREIIVHPGGHYFPATVNEKDKYIRFLKKQQIIKNDFPNSETEDMLIS